MKIVKIIPKEHVNDLCVNCKGKEKNQPVLGMIILEGAVFHQGFWQGAQILNAKNGKRYGCHISLEENVIDRDISLAENDIDREGQRQDKKKFQLCFYSQKISLFLQGHTLFG